MAECMAPWGDGQLRLVLPDHWTVEQVACPAVQPAAPDWPERLAVSLARPEGIEPLADVLRQIGPEGRVVLVVEDITRHSPLPAILAVIGRELDHAGMAPERTEVLFATGMHPAMSAEQAREKIGPFVDRFAWRCNDASAPDSHVGVGAVPLPRGKGQLSIAVDRRCVEADLRIVVSGVTPHLQAGFGGGAKMFVPGCASLATISRLHMAGLTRGHRQRVGATVADNPMRQLIDAAGELLDAAGGRTFAVQYLLDDADLPSAIVSGDLQRGQRMLAKQCAAAAGVVVEAPADILITNAAPRDHDLWQSFKCIANTHWAVRPNGVVIVLARCPAGMNMPTVRWPLSSAWTRRLIRWVGINGIVSMARRFLPGVNPEAHFFIQLAVEAIHRNPIFMYAPEILARGEKFPALAFHGDLAELFAAADKALGPGSRRVILFSAGGASYPVLR